MTPKKQTVVNVLLALLFLALGIGLLVGGTFLKKDSDQKIKEWTHVTGKVVDYTVRNDDDDTMYSEIVQYVVDGVAYTVKSGSSSNVRPTIGKEREVAYNPLKPEDAIIVSDSKFGTTLMFIVGGVFTAVGPLIFVSMFFTKRKGKNAETGTNSQENTHTTGNDNPFSVPHQPDEEPPFREFQSNDRE